MRCFKVVSLYIVHPGSIPNTTYGPLRSIRIVPWALIQRPRAQPEFCFLESCTTWRFSIEGNEVFKGSEKELERNREKKIVPKLGEMVLLFSWSWDPELKQRSNLGRFRLSRAYCIGDQPLFLLSMRNHPIFPPIDGADSSVHTSTKFCFFLLLLLFIVTILSTMILHWLLSFNLYSING